MSADIEHEIEKRTLAQQSAPLKAALNELEDEIDETREVVRLLTAIALEYVEILNKLGDLPSTKRYIESIVVRARAIK